MRLKELREKEKSQFVSQIEHGKSQAKEAQKQRVATMRQNQHYLGQQMDWNTAKRSADHKVEKLYYKPHFGPEETQEIIQKMRQTEQDKINWQFAAVQEQLAEQAADAQQAREDEHAQDVECLRDTAQIQAAEEAKKRRKEYMSR